MKKDNYKNVVLLNNTTRIGRVYFSEKDKLRFYTFGELDSYFTISEFAYLQTEESFNDTSIREGTEIHTKEFVVNFEIVMEFKNLIKSTKGKFYSQFKTQIDAYNDSCQEYGHEYSWEILLNYISKNYTKLTDIKDSHMYFITSGWEDRICNRVIIKLNSCSIIEIHFGELGNLVIKVINSPLKEYIKGTKNFVIDLGEIESINSYVRFVEDFMNLYDYISSSTFYYKCFDDDYDNIRYFSLRAGNEDEASRRINKHLVNTDELYYYHYMLVDESEIDGEDIEEI